MSMRKVLSVNSSSRSGTMKRDLIAGAEDVIGRACAGRRRAADSAQVGE